MLTGQPRDSAPWHLSRACLGPLQGTVPSSPLELKMLLVIVDMPSADETTVFRGQFSSYVLFFPSHIPPVGSCCRSHRQRA